jgi:hypothetical protein
MTTNPWAAEINGRIHAAQTILEGIEQAIEADAAAMVISKADADEVTRHIASARIALCSALRAVPRQLTDSGGHA